MEMTQYRGLKGSGLADVSSVYPSWAAPDSTECPYAPQRNWMYCTVYQARQGSAIYHYILNDENNPRLHDEDRQFLVGFGWPCSCNLWALILFALGSEAMGVGCWV